MAYIFNTLKIIFIIYIFLEIISLQLPNSLFVCSRYLSLPDIFKNHPEYGFLFLSTSSFSPH